MSELTNYTYWKKNGEVRVSNSFMEDEGFRKDGWIKSSRGAYEAYKRAREKAPAQPAASAPDGAGIVTPEGQWEYDELVDRNKELIAQRKALEAELASAEYASSAIESQLAYLSKQVVEGEAELARVKAALADVAPFADWRHIAELLMQAHNEGWGDQHILALGFVTGKAMALDALVKQSAQPADGEPVAGDIPNVAEGLAAQIVHAQMVLQTALGYKEVDYNISLTDLAEDIEQLRAAGAGGRRVDNKGDAKR